MITYILLAISLSLLIASIAIIMLLKNIRSSIKQADGTSQSNAEIQSTLGRLEESIKGEFSTGRRENSETARGLREEVSKNIRDHNNSIASSFDRLTKAQRENFDSFENRIAKMSQANLESQEILRKAVDSSLKNIQEDNKEQLEKVRITVDEKLQGTLEKRLTYSFEQVSERLKQVHEGLGEMKTLAHGVGDLKRVLTNVKTRGTWGEFQLGNILEEVLAPEQYQKNVTVKRNSRESVEYAIKLPGQGNNELVYLPIDSKFPQEDYQKLVASQESAEPEMAKAAASNLEKAIKREARSIRDKYISPPNTTDFAIMFLPSEGLYAEVLRMPGLADLLQREYRVTIAGPTTLAALLNSLSVGFRTLAIQKRSSDVWKLLGTVKKQFSNFSGLLEKVQKKLDDASSEMEKASKTSKTIEKRLSDVEVIPPSTPYSGVIEHSSENHLDR